MLVEWRVYFGVKSQALAPDEVTRLIGIEPDESCEKGSRDPQHKLPRAHCWKIHSVAPKWEPSEEGIGTHEFEARTAELAEKLQPFAGNIKALVQADEIKATLCAVRTFRKGELAHASIGMALSAQLVEFLASAGASIDIDEYDETYDEDEDPEIPWIEGPTKVQRLL